MKVLIAVPCMDQVSARFAQCLAMLQKPCETAIAFQLSSLIYDARNKLALEGLRQNADYVLWLDSDMTFAPDTLIKLLKNAENGCDIVAGIYFKRVPPFEPVAMKMSEAEDGRVKVVSILDYPETLFECDAVGFGCVLTKTETLIDVFTSFGTAFEPEYGAGEDIAFCKRAKATGAKIWVDPSIKCGHVGQLVVTEESFKALR